MAAAGQPAVEWRSQFERKLRDRLDALGVRYLYEPTTFPLALVIPGHYCLDCNSKRVGRTSQYTPDFYFPLTDTYVEAKGKFTAKDRKRCLAFFEQKGEGRKYALLFMRNNRLSKGSKTTYVEWANKNGIPCAVNWFRPEWYMEDLRNAHRRHQEP